MTNFRIFIFTKTLLVKLTCKQWLPPCGDDDKLRQLDLKFYFNTIHKQGLDGDLTIIIIDKGRDVKTSI
jgi:hypothetical protein